MTHFRNVLLAAASALVLAGSAIAQDAVTDPVEPTPTTDPAPVVTEPAPNDGTVEEEDKSGPGTAVSTQARELKNVEGPRKDAAKQLRATALANNPGYQAAVAKQPTKPGEEDEDETAGTAAVGHPTADDHPGKDNHPDGDDNPGVDDHPTPDDHPDETSNPGDLASEDRGKPDDLPEPDDRPGKDDHPTGRPGGG